MKYTKSALGLLNAQYKSVLKKCLLINLGLFAMVAATATPALAADTAINYDASGTITAVGGTPISGAGTFTIPDVSGKADASTTLAGYGITNAYTKGEVDSGFVKSDLSNLTAAQQGAINSGITNTDVTQIATNKTDIATLNTWKTNLATASGAANAIDGSNIKAGTVALTALASTDLANFDNTNAKFQNDTQVAASIKTGAENADYTNTTSGLSATTIKGAIDEVVSDIKVTTAGKYISTGVGVATNLGALDTAIGDMSGFGTNNHIATTTTNVAANLTSLDGAVYALTTDTSTGAINVANANVGTQLKVGTNTTITDGVVAATTVNATTLKAGANTTLTNGQLALGDGINSATLTTNTNGLVVDKGLTAGGGKFQVDGNGTIQDVRGINIGNGSTTAPKVALTVTDDGTNSTLNIGDDTKVKGTFAAGATGAEFTVDGSGNTVAAGTVKIGGASGATLTGTATSLTSDKKVVSANGFEVDANTSLTAANGLKVGDGTNNSSLTKTQLTVDGGSTLTKTDLTTTTVNATTVNAGTNGTALTDNSLVLNGGSSKVATLTGTTSGLNVAEGLTVATNKFTVNGTNGNTTVGGTLKVGGANAITGTANTLAMGSNSLTGIADIASTSLTTSASGKTVAIGGTGYTTTVTGNEVVTGTVQIGGTSGAKLTGTATDLTSDKKVISSNGFEVNASNYLTAGKFGLAGTEVNTINNSAGIARSAAGSTTALATTSVVVGTIKNQAEDATYSNTITTGSNITTATINGALANLDTSIGDRSTLSATNGNLTSGATVVASLNALDTTLGNVHALDGTTGTQTGNLAPANSSVAAHLAAIDDRLGQITGLYDGSTVHSTNVTSTVNGNSNLRVGSTVEDHLVSLDNSVGDRTLASSNTAINTAMSGTSMAAGLQAAGNAIGDMNFASTRYVSGDTDLSSAVRTLDSNMARIDNEVRDLRHDFNSGMAQLSAMSALVPNPRAAGDTSLSLGTGAYNGHTAMAFGGFHYITDNILLNAGASWGNSNDMSYRLGVTWSF